MHPVSNRPASFYDTAKMHKFEHQRDMTKENIKFRPIIDQTGTYTYNAVFGKVSIQLMILKVFLKNFQLYHLCNKMKRVFCMM